jgi:hypothetical protein
MDYLLIAHLLLQSAAKQTGSPAGKEMMCLIIPAE